MNCYRQRQRRLQNTEPTARVSSARQANQPVSLTNRVLLGKLHQTANLLADLLIGTQDVIALLLPDILETHLLLWGGQAAGVVCPIHPYAPLDQIVALVRMVGAKVLAAPGPEMSQGLWRKAELLTGREIASDDIAIYFHITDTTGTSSFVPLTHGALLYAAWAFSLVSMLAPEKVLLRCLLRFFQGVVGSGWVDPLKNQVSRSIRACSFSQRTDETQ